MSMHQSGESRTVRVQNNLSYILSSLNHTLTRMYVATAAVAVVLYETTTYCTAEVVGDMNTFL